MMADEMIRSRYDTIYGGPQHDGKGNREELESRTFSTDRTLRWQRPDATTQSLDDSKEVQNP